MVDTLPAPTHNTRLGFHYFPNSLHFRQLDLDAWLPELLALGASWLVLKAPYRAAIPESFVRGLLEAGVEPILHFDFGVDQAPPLSEMRLLFTTYARWGVRYAALFDRPNTPSAWGPAAWMQSSLVERFLDAYLPLASASQQAGLTPVFSPLQPGGDYWDTAFLRAALEGMQRRGFACLFEQLLIGAYAWYGGRPLDWGAGGPERWPAARPYHTPSGSQDQCGFRIFDWYSAVFEAVTGMPGRVLLLKVGREPVRPFRSGLQEQPELADSHIRHSKYSLDIARRLAAGAPGQSAEMKNGGAPISETVVAANFWLLAAPAGHPATSQAWYQPGGFPLPAVGVFKQWAANRQAAAAQPLQPALAHPLVSKAAQAGGAVVEPHPGPSPNGRQPIGHYLLLPAFDWGVSEWHLDVIRPFVKRHRPTIGFSLEEARLAKRVTVVGGEKIFPAGMVNELRNAGCTVHQIEGDGTIIATQLATLDFTDQVSKRGMYG